MQKQSGFTLIELFVVLAIAAILAMLAVPSFKSMIQSNTISSSVNTFMSDLRFARSEAIRLGGAVTICRSDTPEDPAATCNAAGSGGWRSGWIVFNDLNNDAARANTEPVLRVQPRIASIDEITEVGGTPAYVFTFTTTGRLKNASALTTVQFGGSTYASAVRRMVCVTLGGRARIAGDGSSSCT